MYVQVYLLGKDNRSWHINCRSINQPIDELRNEVAEKFLTNSNNNNNHYHHHNDNYKCDPSCVRLFLHGKELKNGYSFYDYNIKINDIIVALIKENDTDGITEITNIKKTNTTNTTNTNKTTTNDLKNQEQVNNSKDEEETFINQDEYYKVGDYVDAVDSESGAWFEGKIIKIKSENNNCNNKSSFNDLSSNSIYYIEFERQPLQGSVVQVRLSQIRPQSDERIRCQSLNQNDLVLVNYDVNSNSGRPLSRQQRQLGYWYDCRVEKILNHSIIGTILINDLCDGNSPTAVIKSTRICHIGEIYKIESNVKREFRSQNDEVLVDFGAKDRRTLPAECRNCQDNINVRCKVCSCHECGGKNAPEKQIICDECESIYHIWCLCEPLTQVPREDWYCKECRNDKDKQKIQNDQALSLELRRSKLNRQGVREWGRGVACMGRTKICHTVGKDHFGPIPDIQVGTWWRFRFQASESGVHTPLVAGIHGKENIGAYSIVFSCSYDHDIDLGHEFYYTASGGKDSSVGKSRVGGPQIKDQELKRSNRALAVSCHAEFNNDTGANAGLDWQKGKPVRVLRSGNPRGSSKKSLYLPKIGVRYDGIYKVVKYWPEITQAGFVIWRFLMRRHDPTPAPWTKEGKARIRKLGLQLIYPPGWHQYAANKKRLRIDQHLLDKQKKKPKIPKFALSREIVTLMDNDKSNYSLWETIQQYAKDLNKNEFYEKVQELFKCVCCLEIVKKPVTTSCGHNICKECLNNSFDSGVDTCPICRNKLNKRKLIVNHTLENILTMIINKM